MNSIPPPSRRNREPRGCPKAAPCDDWRVALLVAAGLVILLYDPAMWLAETWADSGYDSAGGHLSVVVAGLAVWSITSAVRDDAGASTIPWEWLGTAAVLRLAGHLLAIPYIGAVAIPIGVYALGRLAGLHLRRRAVSPGWLAVLAGLTLPVEHVLKRLFGHGLQQRAADGSCHLLGAIYDDVTCAGLDIALRGRELFVDLPCSGARTLVLFSIVFAGLAAVVRPRAWRAVAGFGLVVFVGFAVNALRIALLTAGLAHEPSLGFDVMEHPWHMAVGLACLPVGLVPLVAWARWARRPRPVAGTAPRLRAPATGYVKMATVALIGASVALAVSVVPQFPVHTAESADAIELPAGVGGHPKKPQAPGPIERRYFTQYGGAIAIADYGPHTLIVTETDAPLRHIHRPDQWLGNAGFTVEKLGHTPGVLPADTYRVERPDSRVRRLDVTYVSDCGRIATSVAEVLWHWWSAPETTWRAYLRLHPLDTSASHLADFDRQITRFFEINPNSHR